NLLKMSKILFKLKTFIFPIATLSGTIIGVGFFSLPYITSKVGIWVMLGYFLVLGTLVILVHLFFGELALKTPDLKRLPGFAAYHLGKWGEKIALLSSIFGIFGAILAYLIVGGEFLENLLSPIFGGGNFVYTLIYFIFGAILIFFGIKAISKFEFWALILFFSILIFIFFRGFSQIKLSNLFLSPDFSQLFLPYGPILFSLWGAALIPEVEEMLKERKDLLKWVIFLSVLIPIFVYLFFIYLILGITGSQTTEFALTGLRNFLGDEISSLALLFGILTTFTSFITLGLTLKKIFWYDLKIKKNLAWAITCFFPLILFLIGIKSFIPVITFIGGIMLGIDGILILLMYHKLQVKSQNYIPPLHPPALRAGPSSKVKSLLMIFPFVLVFLAGIIYEIIYFL
ncbi:MAG: aromatic amino acid transport family protein, partial [Patescibacteria group bacterium]|nr:aromatic amino acid transport family protein [Patescibacteria group bacterium]